MGANKKIGLKKAVQVRKELIAELETCKSAGKLIEIEKAYAHKKHLLKLFEINPQFNKRDRDLLETRDVQIANLFAEKRQEFASKLAQIIEQRRLAEEQERQEELKQKEQLLSSSEVSIEEIDEPVDTVEDTTSATGNGFTITIPEENTSIISEPSLSEEVQQQIDAQRVKDLIEVKKHLDRLSDKSAEFAGKIHALLQQDPVDIWKLADYTTAKTAMDSINKGINGLYENYIYGRINLAEFKKEAKPYLNEESEHVQTLQSHRGVKEILLNLLAAIVGLGIFYGIAAAVKGSFLVFKPATDSGEKLSDLGKSIENTVSPAA